MQFERKLEKVEAALILLEAKLSSIPEVNQQLPTSTPESTNILDTNTSQSKSDNEENCNKGSENKGNKIEESEIPPEYIRFLKMIQVGVPLEAVKLKASVEGLNPDVLQKLI
ncbi:WASH complex subunit 3 [Eumeta japonica]|uniref:WASH complex subunit 3 n=1 Tax=Eumeta variegata TaxID=151549 RepID=A0A4C1ZI91_EUMVA|nr:WASH complex subunit 3 [Eumeta japonica]